MPAVPLHRNNAFRNEPKFGHFLLVSLIVHGLIWIAFTGDWFGARVNPKPPIFVDLVHKPVLNPQAGRPDPRPSKKQQAAPVKKSVATPGCPEGSDQAGGQAAGQTGQDGQAKAGSETGSETGSAPGKESAERHR